MPSIDLTWKLIRPSEGFYTSEVAQPERRPLRTFLPTGYEPRYPYPLIVFFHGHGGNEEQVLRLAPRLSRRNFICLGLRGVERARLRQDGTMGFSWGLAGKYDTLIEDYVFRAIEQTRREYHVHSERIYLAGVCEGATMAYKLGLTFPEKFGGVISLNGMLPPRGSLFLRLKAVRQLPVFMGHGIANAVVPLASARQDFRALYAAGLEIAFRTYPATHRLHPEMLRDVNRWIIDRCT